MSNDPYATGNDGLALSDSSNALDNGPAWNIPASGYGAGPAWDIPIAGTNVTTSGLPWGTGSGSAGTPDQTGYFTQPSSNGSSINWGTASTSPGNGWSGTTWPTGAYTGGILNSLLGVFTGVSQVQQNANAQQIAGQPFLTRLGLANGAGQITSTGTTLLFAGLAVAALLLLKR